MNPPFRCARASEDRDEPLVGTASTVRAFLLVEAPGPWGVDAVEGSRVSAAVKRFLTVEAARHRVRPLLIRRHGRAARRLTVFAAYADPDVPWVETTSLADPDDLLDLDLAALGTGRSLGLAEHTAPLFLVCTHGRHDVCCAERGRPVAAELSALHPAETWEVSHIGGDRFAGNMLVLPDGLYYGRLTPAGAARVADRHHAGMLDLEHLRGRCGYPFAVQAAETFLRRELAVSGHRDLTLVSARRADDVTAARFSVAGRPWQVRVRTTGSPLEQLTCRARRTNPGTLHELVSISEG